MSHAHGTRTSAGERDPDASSGLSDSGGG